MITVSWRASQPICQNNNSGTFAAHWLGSLKQNWKGCLGSTWATPQSASFFSYWCFVIWLQYRQYTQNYTVKKKLKTCLAHNHHISFKHHRFSDSSHCCNKLDTWKQRLPAYLLMMNVSTMSSSASFWALLLLFDIKVLHGLTIFGLCP